MKLTKKEVASYIDHTLLSPEASHRQISQLCTEALRYGFASVCVNPTFVSFASESLKDSSIKVCSVVGFPFGASNSNIKAAEAMDAVSNGADEVDMVINISSAIDGNFTVVGKDIAMVVEGAKNEGLKLKKNIIVKVIMETCFLDDETLRMCCLCAKKAGADFVKTSTGYATQNNVDGRMFTTGASAHHVSLMRQVVGADMGVKASGGIRSASMLAAMLEAGANRIGSSSGVKIVDTWNESLDVKLGF